MRKASQDNGIIVIDGKFIGVSLGFDFTAEHEWGTEELHRAFGILDSGKKSLFGKRVLGVKSRTITKCIKNLIFKEETYKKNKYALLYSASDWRSFEEAEKYTPTDIQHYKEDIAWSMEWDKKNPREGREPQDPIVTAWDGGSFGIGVMGEKEAGYMKELYEAFKNINVVIARANMKPNNPFSNSSLSLLIADRIPEEVKEQMYGADKKYFDLVDYEEKIGMTKLKENTKAKDYKKLHYYCACSAKWIDYEDKEAREEQKAKMNTKHDIWYWVNYSDDDDNYGHYSVEEIKEWLSGKRKLTEIRKAH